MYKGGFIVPILIGSFLTVITFSIERFITISKSKGTGRIEAFIEKIRAMMSRNDIAAAEAECQRQRGSVANVVHAGIQMYRQMENEPELDKERKILAIQKELEEATTLELPMLSKNLVIISTIASIATLMGLLGTVIGMIRAFSALATAGAPDAVALSTGISEALINTALGVGTSALAIIMYNYFTSRIDSITYGIDEAGYTIVQSFASKTKS
jgi:biopolymer transport protein ExbB